jgi:hypothetical protein
MDEQRIDVGGGERTLHLSEEDQRSVNILRDIQDTIRFDRRGNEVVFYYSRNNYGELVPSTKYPVEDFLKAVDYYQENRDLELRVNMAMTKKDGVVDVYAPFEKGAKERPVVVSIKNYMVPQILEFAYLLVRSSHTQK